MAAALLEAMLLGSHVVDDVRKVGDRIVHPLVPLGSGCIKVRIPSHRQLNLPAFPGPE
ncbi:MAG: hypothetical protein A4E63_01285 [Syntrophorhabdus sp. PtaU1.Bin050]|nr:MAG: hypothetical protein A4E63_01285 [Syntrophorhabdus sp. PtaU1.Bin050]